MKKRTLQNIALIMTIIVVGWTTFGKATFNMHCTLHTTTNCTDMKSINQAKPFNGLDACVSWCNENCKSDIVAVQSVETNICKQLPRNKAN